MIYWYNHGMVWVILLTSNRCEARLSRGDAILKYENLELEHYYHFLLDVISGISGRTHPLKFGIFAVNSLSAKKTSEFAIFDKMF